MGKLMENKDFREKFDKEYQKLCVAEKIAKIRHQVNLTQDALVNRKERINPFKSDYIQLFLRSLLFPLLFIII